MDSTAMRLASIALVCFVASVPAPALAVSYSEGVNGDLSGTAASPTSLGTLGVGAHTLTASTVTGDFDLLTFSLSSGTVLSSIILNSYSGSSVSFTGLASGSTWPTGLGGAIDPTTLLGWTHFGALGPATVGTNILDDIGVGGFGSTGFTPPLPAGNYTLELQETGPIAVSFMMTFNVVPEPSAGVLAIIAIIGALAFRRR
jgi:hypothetical protein